MISRGCEQVSGIFGLEEAEGQLQFQQQSEGFVCFNALKIISS